MLLAERITANTTMKESQWCIGTNKKFDANIASEKEIKMWVTKLRGDSIRSRHLV